MGFLDFGYENPADKAMPYINQISGKTQQYYQPYINAGQQSLTDAQKQYGMLTSDPGARMNQIGQGYQQSPGFQFAMQQALQGANHASAAGGMAGSPQSQQQNMQLANNMANQDYNQYLQNAMGMYNTGLQGQQGIAQMGQQSGNAYADMIAQQLAQQANLAYTGQQNNNENSSNLFKDMFSAIGGAAGAIPGLGTAVKGAISAL